MSLRSLFVSLLVLAIPATACSASLDLDADLAMDTGAFEEDTAALDTAEDEVGFAADEIVPTDMVEGEITTLVVLGTGFRTGVDVRIGGLSITGLEVLNGETIEGISPSALTKGTHAVEVVQDGQSIVLPNAFTVYGDGVKLGLCGCSQGGGLGSLGLGIVGLGMAFARRRGLWVSAR